MIDSEVTSFQSYTPHIASAAIRGTVDDGDIGRIVVLAPSQRDILREPIKLEDAHRSWKMAHYMSPFVDNGQRVENALWRRWTQELHCLPRTNSIMLDWEAMLCPHGRPRLAADIVLFEASGFVPVDSVDLEELITKDEALRSSLSDLDLGNRLHNDDISDEGTLSVSSSDIGGVIMDLTSSGRRVHFNICVQQAAIVGQQDKEELCRVSCDNAESYICTDSYLRYTSFEPLPPTRLRDIEHESNLLVFVPPRDMSDLQAGDLIAPAPSSSPRKRLLVMIAQEPLLTPMRNSRQLTPQLDQIEEEEEELTIHPKKNRKVSVSTEEDDLCFQDAINVIASHYKLESVKAPQGSVNTSIQKTSMKKEKEFVIEEEEENEEEEWEWEWEWECIDL